MPSPSLPIAPPARRVGGRPSDAPDEDAFARLLDAHRPRLEAYARRMTGDAAQAEDVVQEVFVSALRASRGGTVPDDPAAWLHAIARRACIDEHRRRGRRVEASPETTGTPDADLVAADTDGEDPVPRAWGRRREVRVLEAAFGDLTPVQHDVLVQRELEGRSSDEIATRTGLARGAVEGHLARGRRALRTAYGELDSGERCRDVRRLCTAASGRAPSSADRRVRAHLRACSPCRKHAIAAGVPVPRTRRAGAFLLLPLGPLRGLLAGAGDGAAAAAGTKLAPALATVALAGVAVPLTAPAPSRDDGPVAASGAAPSHASPARSASRASVPGAPAAGVRVASAGTGAAVARPRRVGAAPRTTAGRSRAAAAVPATSATPSRSTPAAAPRPASAGSPASAPAAPSSTRPRVTEVVPRVTRDVAAPAVTTATGVVAPPVSKATQAVAPTVSKATQAVAPVVPRAAAAATPVVRAVGSATARVPSVAGRVAPVVEGAFGGR